MKITNKIVKSLELLREYSGTNDYLLQVQQKMFKEKSFSLTQTQSDYIRKNHNVEPEDLNKLVGITSWLGDNLKKQFELQFSPTKILVEKVLADMGKTYHVKGKFYQNQRYSSLYYIPKTQLMDDIWYDEPDVYVDWEKYSHREPFPHQKTAIEFALKRDRTILGLDMGLGKTVTSIVTALESEAKKILIICPASLKINWKREIEYYSKNVVIVNGSFYKSARFTIINYDILKNFHTIVDPKKDYEDWELQLDILADEYDMMILDEAHLIKNPKAIRSKMVTDLAKYIPKVLLLTGTPISNRPMDFYSLLKLCESPVTYDWRYYAVRYCDAKSFKKHTNYGKMRQVWITDGASNLNELHERTKPILLRMRKEEAVDLPDKIISTKYYEVESRNEYDTVFDEYVKWMKSEGKSLGFARQLVELTVLRKYVAYEKIKHTLEMAEAAVEEGKKVIIFTNFTAVIERLAEEFGNKAVILYGQMSQKDRQISIDSFQQNPKIKVFIGNIKAAGVGLTLTEGEVVIFNDLSWVPSEHSQAEDRAHRIGQDKKVNVLYPILVDTVDEIIYNVLQRKQLISDTILGEVSEGDLKDALKGYFNQITT